MPLEDHCVHCRYAMAQRMLTDVHYRASSLHQRVQERPATRLCATDAQQLVSPLHQPVQERPATLLCGRHSLAKGVPPVIIGLGMEAVPHHILQQTRMPALQNFVKSREQALE